MAGYLILDLKNTLVESSVSGYSLRKGTLETLKTLREEGWVLILGVNSSNPQKVYSILKLEEGGTILESLFDGVCISSEVSCKKPDPQFIKCALSKVLNEPQVEEALPNTYVAGGMLDTDILAGQKAGVKTVWINLLPSVSSS